MPKNIRNPYLPPSPLEGMKGGQKSMWLRQHRDLVVGIREFFGDEFCQHLFCLSNSTYNNLIKTNPRTITPGGLNMNIDIERLSLRIEQNHADLVELRRCQQELESLFNRFVESTGNQISKALIIPLIRNVLKFEGELPENVDPLSIERLLAGCSRDAHGKQIGGSARIPHE